MVKKGESPFFSYAILLSDEALLIAPLVVCRLGAMTGVRGNL